MGLRCFVSFRNFFSDNTRVRIIIFFVALSANFFFQNKTLGYFFFLHQNQNIFFSNIGNQNIVLEKKTITVLAHWNNILREDMSIPSDTLSRFQENQSLLLLLDAVCLGENHQMPMLLFLVWPDRDLNPRSIAL
jgi:hypothetical protein